MTSIVYLGRNNLDSTATFAISGVRYEYFLSPIVLDKVEYMAMRISPYKALNFAKKRATSWQRRK